MYTDWASNSIQMACCLCLYVYMCYYREWAVCYHAMDWQFGGVCLWLLVVVDNKIIGCTCQ